MADGVAWVRIPFRQGLVGDPFRLALHGGIVATLLDATGGAAVWSPLSLAYRVSSIDIRVDYLRPGRLADLVAGAQVCRVGHRVGVAHTTAFHPDAPVAEAMGVYAVRRESAGR